MIKKLRLKFALSAIISVLLVLIVLVGGINLLNYNKIVSESDQILKFLSDNNGAFPEFWMFDEPFEPEPGRRGNRLDSPELAFETRYFSVLFDENGDILITNTGMISAVSPSRAESYASKVINSGKTKGFIGDYRYSVLRYNDDGSVLVVFVDCGLSLSNFRNFLAVSVTISAVCLLIISIAVFLISGKAVKPVAESYEKQKRFITDAGHEIKTPLAIINADSDVLMTEVGEENEWLTDIKKQTERLTELTNELVLLTKMEEGSSSLVFEKINLSSLVEDQADSFKVLADAGKKDLETDITNDIHINGDKKTIYELLSILLDNAVKYCPEGKKIYVRCYKDDRYARLEVSNDTSDDISEANLKNLFDRFYRTDSSRNSETGGHGIGLSIAKAIVEAHKGKISAKKDKPNSIKFKVSFRL
ncbi:MAG: HAMP domain-containing histidine kinase [Clostridiales bacterium]|nr:HAMP domain-containing histidine kinase [Clostridiales bacterium]